MIILLLSTKRISNFFTIEAYIKHLLPLNCSKSALQEVGKEMVGGVGSDGGAVKFLQPPGKTLHVFLVSTVSVKPAAVVQLADEVLWRGGGNSAAVPQGVDGFHAESFFV